MRRRGFGRGSSYGLSFLSFGGNGGLRGPQQSAPERPPRDERVHVAGLFEPLQL